MESPARALAAWHEFYTLLGAASATMIGLLFVAASVGSGAFSSGRSAPVRVFLSASVVNFSGVLAASAIVLVPVLDWRALGGLIAACGLLGVGYYGLTWRDMMRDGLSKKLDREDFAWYAVLPVIGYLGETASGVILAMRLPPGCEALAASIGLLLVVGIHNAWDITVWSITRGS